MTMQDRLRVGDDIITAGGLHATVRSIEGDVLEIELAPGTIVRLDRRAVAAVADRDEPGEEETAEGEEIEEEEPVSTPES
jgi:preprotein translocase subunit YajC